MVGWRNLVISGLFAPPLYKLDSYGCRSSGMEVASCLNRIICDNISVSSFFENLVSFLRLLESYLCSENTFIYYKLHVIYISVLLNFLLSTLQVSTQVNLRHGPPRPLTSMFPD